MGCKQRPEAHSKVRPSTPLYDILSVTNNVVKMEGNRVNARAIDDPPIGEFPRVGKDGHQQYRDCGKRSGILTSRAAREVPI